LDLSIISYLNDLSMLEQSGSASYRLCNFKCLQEWSWTYKNKFDWLLHKLTVHFAVGLINSDTSDRCSHIW